MVGKLRLEDFMRAEDQVDGPVRVGAGPPAHRQRAELLEALRGLWGGDAADYFLDRARQGIEAMQAGPALTGALGGHPPSDARRFGHRAGLI
jgi:hypothetical protein